ncbi:MAG: hypothetical protein O3B87_00445 [bacterium]|nr:hypothetical protein [bacterium]
MKKINLSIKNTVVPIDFNTHFKNLAHIADSLNHGASKHYKKMGLTYVDVPEIVGITGACENVDTLFVIQNRNGIPLFFAQTGQLSLEQILQTLPGAYTVIHSGRDEEYEDARHLRQFRLTEEEFDCTLVNMNRDNYDEEKMFQALLNHIQCAVQAMIYEVIQDHQSLLENTYHRDIEVLHYTSSHDFQQISYGDAVELLNDNGFPKVQFGDDLKSEHEACVIEVLNKGETELPVFITKYPKDIKFFNMKVSEKDPRVVLSADLILPYAGEATGSAVREHDFKKLDERLTNSTMFKLHTQRGGTYDDFKWYLDIIKSKKTNPHAGYGIGNERVLQYIFGEKDIRNVSLFSLLNNQTGDWDKSKQGNNKFVK